MVVSSPYRNNVITQTHFRESVSATMSHHEQGCYLITNYCWHAVVRTDGQLDGFMLGQPTCRNRHGEGKK